MSDGIGVVAFENELNCIVQEYLDFCDYSRTSQAFEDECLVRGKKLEKLAERRKKQKALEIQNEMLQHVRKGNRKLFFECWEREIPREIRNNDGVAKKLEFYLHMYFAIHPLKFGAEYQMHAEENMAAFKKYLETRGNALSQTTEFLPYYALPFVLNPKSHPTYRNLFNDLWIQEIQIRLEKFLTLTLESIEQPRLFDLYKTATGQGGEEYIVKINCLEQKLYESEKKAANYMRRHNKVQTDYHNLIGITAELVDALEATLQGKKISPDFLPDILARLFRRQSANQLIEWDLSRPGSAGLAIRESARSQKKPRTPKPQIDVDGYPPNLDYVKMKIDLINADARRKALLLQALRWRLTKSPPGDHRTVVMKAMIESDILGCTYDGAFRQEVVALLRNRDELVQPSLARLLNAFASYYDGRKYLTQNMDLINVIIEVLRTSDRSDSYFPVSDQHLLATLQKLSLRRMVQSKVIESGLVVWLVDQLEHFKQLGDYSLEYSVALFMNLCLRSAGKLACVPVAARALNSLSALMAHNNLDIIPYVNGAMYSLLSVEAIRNVALSLDLEGTLRALMTTTSADNKRQLEYIIKQLNTTEQKGVRESDEDEQEEEEFDDPEQDGIEPDVDLSDAVSSAAEEPHGELLLLTDYYTATVRPSTARSQNGVQNAPQNDASSSQPAPDRPVPPLAADNPPLADSAPAQNGNAASSVTYRKNSNSDSLKNSSLNLPASQTKPFESRAKIPRTPARNTASPNAENRQTPQADRSTPSPPKTPRAAESTQLARPAKKEKQTRPGSGNRPPDKAPDEQKPK